MRKRLASLVAVSVLVALAWACGELTSTTESCSKAADCLAPYVCCTNPRTPPYGKAIPYCESQDSCDAFMPFLVVGNPCERTPLPRDHRGRPDDVARECADGLECCKATLVCGDAGSCVPDTFDAGALADAEAGAPPSCTADPDCRAPEVCCNISFTKRDGECRSVESCRQFTGR